MSNYQGRQFTICTFKEGFATELHRRWARVNPAKHSSFLYLTTIISFLWRIRWGYSAALSHCRQPISSGWGLCIDLSKYHSRTPFIIYLDFIAFFRLFRAALWQWNNWSSLYKLSQCSVRSSYPTDWQFADDDDNNKTWLLRINNFDILPVTVIYLSTETETSWLLANNILADRKSAARWRQKCSTVHLTHWWECASKSEPASDIHGEFNED